DDSARDARGQVANPAGHDSHLTPVFELVMAIPSQPVPFGFEVGELGAKQPKPTGSDVVLDARRQRSTRGNDGLFPGLILRERLAHGTKISRGSLGRQSSGIAASQRPFDFSHRMAGVPAAGRISLKRRISCVDRAVSFTGRSCSRSPVRIMTVTG